jgi:PAS domain S-box-containing protein
MTRKGFESPIEERSAPLGFSVDNDERSNRCVGYAVDTSDDAIIGLGTDGLICSWSRGARRIYGYEPAEAMGCSFAMLLSSNQPSEVQHLWETLERGAGVFFLETTGVHKSGRSIDVAQRFSPMLDEDGAFVGAVAVIHDLTSRKRLEQALRDAETHFSRDRASLRALASELVLAEEHERSLLAEGLHDHLGQLLSLAKMKIAMMLPDALEHQLGDPLREIGSLLDEMLESVRSMTFELSPPVLHHLGLGAATEWLAKNMRERFGLDVQLEVEDRPLPLDKRIRVIMFRSIRELLVNVSKHAQASHAVLAMHRSGRDLVVFVEDDGVGFDQEATELKQAGSGRGFGLFSIRERLVHLGGGMRVRSSPNDGTSIMLTAPLSLENDEVLS